MGNHFVSREECRELADVFFKEVFQHPNYPNIGIRFLGTTATLPTRYVPAIERLTTLNFTPSSIYRGSPVDFEQREIEMTLQICSVGGYVNIALTSAVEYLTTDTRKGKLVIFTNSAYKSFHYLKELEKKLNLKGGDWVDIIHITGGLHKTPKRVGELDYSVIM